MRLFSLALRMSAGVPPQDLLRDFPEHANLIMEDFEGDWGRLAEDFAHDPVVTQAIKDEIERRREEKS